MRKVLLLLVLLCIQWDVIDANANLNWTKYQFIAHGGGGIDGKTYTNSIEAFYENYGKGFRLFEFDITLTNDQKLVARHGWDEKIGQGEIINGQPLSYQRFMDTLYYGQYHPMDFEMIIKFLKKYPNIYIILDGKVNSPKEAKDLYKEIGKAVEGVESTILQRIIPQIFYIENVDEVRQYGFYDVIYVVGREQYNAKDLSQICKEKNIQVVSLSTKRSVEGDIQAFVEKNIKVYTYTVNDFREVELLSNIGVHGFFTDFITNLHHCFADEVCAKKKI